MKFKHATTGRVIGVREGSYLARLVEADDNWSEVKSTSTKETGDGSGDAGGRGSRPRKAAQRKRSGSGSESSD